MKKYLLTFLAGIACAGLHAAPGFYFAKFSGSPYDGTSDIWSSGSVVASASMLYSSGYGGSAYYPSENYQATFAYAAFMFFRGGVTYKFRAGWDDYASVKVDDTMVVPRTAGCQHGYGDIQFPNDGWHRIELRVSNDSGCYGNGDNNMGEFFGAHFSVDNGVTWNSFVTTSGHSSIFQTEIPVSYCTPIVLTSAIRDNDPTILDVKYIVFSDKPTVKVRVLAFEDGERSFAKVVRPETFIEGTEVNVGDNVTPNVEHTISWRVSSDWTTKLAKVKFEVLACEGDLLPLELMTIPASDQYGAMKISWNAISEQQWFDALLWLYADHDSGLTLENGVLKNNNNEILSDGAGIYKANLGYRNWEGTGYYYKYEYYAHKFVYSKMGYSVLSGNVLNYANQETRLGLSPSGSRQYAYKMVP